MLGEAGDRVRLDARAGAARDVVQHHRQAARVGDLAEVRLHRVLRRPAVVRRDHQQTVRARLFGGQRQVHGVPGVRGADPGDECRAVPDGLPDRRHQRRLLGVRGGRRLARGAGQDQAVAALRDQVHGEPRGAVGIERAGLGEGRDHGAQGAAEGGGGAVVVCRHGSSVGGRTV